jgi:hypothetical protein
MVRIVEGLLSGRLRTLLSIPSLCPKLLDNDKGANLAAEDIPAAVIRPLRPQSL